jgi:glycosyltransferase involved in cell wall biosynthesis
VKILITNHALDRRAGTELYVRDLAFGLKASGHLPICFSPELGVVADEIRRSGIDVTDDLGTVPPPDIIHAHHHAPSAMAFMAFPHMPAVSVCHGVLPWQEAPLAKFPNIRRYVAVDKACHDFLVEHHNVPEDRISVILNGVDLKRFSCSGTASVSEARQKKALVFSNIASPADLHPFRRACDEFGISLELAGAAGRILDCPEQELAEYGLVFAKGRAAIEAMAMGCAVILSDYGRTGPLVTTRNYDVLRPLNFGFRTLQDPPEKRNLVAKIAELDWTDAASVSGRIRRDADFSDAVDSWIEIYARLAAASPVHGDNSQAIASSSYIRAILPQLTERDELASRYFLEVRNRIDAGKELASLIAAAVCDPDRTPELLRQARLLDPENELLKQILADPTVLPARKN